MTRRCYRFGEAETEGAILGFGEVAGLVAGATEIAADGTGLVVAGADVVTAADGAADDEGADGLTGRGETETPGRGVAEIAGAGVCPLLNPRLRLLGVFAF